MIKYLSSFILQRYKKFLVYLIFIIKIIMPTARPFAFNTGSTISGTSQVGQLAIGVVVVVELPVQVSFGGMVLMKI
jgi:hypothetical protein